MTSWLLAGGLVTGITMVWGYIRSLWQQAASHVIVTCDTRGRTADAVTLHCWKNFKCSRFGFRAYYGWHTFVRPVKRVQLVAIETVGQSAKLYWKGWRPIWVTRMANEDKNGFRMNGEYVPAGMRLTFLRGTFDSDTLVSDAVDSYNHAYVSTDTQSRYRVCHVFGTAGKPATLSHESLTSTASSDSEVMVAAQNRLLRWKTIDIGTSRTNHGRALDQLALPPEAVAMATEIGCWKESENWYKERGIPWRRGWGLSGLPGTGKTSLIRAVGEDFDLPVYAYHLSTLHNNELQEAWQKMLTCVPCIALIEDIDGVFDGRTNKSGPLTFDCLLNCMDGVERADGVLLVVTTNCPDKLDPALGERPGRIDHMLTLGPLDQAGRYKLCKRILKEWPGLWDEVVTVGVGETGAQFQERLTQLALNHYWEAKRA
jgi:hypothetical protein